MKKDFQFSYELLSDWKDLSIEDQILVDKAYDALETAYAPYSEFKVGASVRLDNDAIITGSNQENAAYPSGLCAERVALFHIGSNYPKQSIKTICVVAKGDLLPLDKLLSPCGGCRQVMLESENRQQNKIKVIIVNQDNRTMVIPSVIDLLPFGFGS
ncbi:cytidine deaminase [Crocinitomicaceae bacterium]|jgi:cytidine deaminase|nr:cytidine deaminase [Crocinitomicaceae bacterium]MDA8910517.1 cytidine deaminase [Crocinitomicaceae bacterium]MDC3308757.1 cytidine deaminase [Crocinitomicaceae bacterium]